MSGRDKPTAIHCLGAHHDQVAVVPTFLPGQDDRGQSGQRPREMDVHNYLHPVIAAAGAYVLVANGINLFR